MNLNKYAGSIPLIAKNRVSMPSTRPIDPCRPENRVKPFSFVAMYVEKMHINEARNPAILWRRLFHFQRCARYLLV